MNTFVLMAEIITKPELRKTPDDLDVANMTVEFPGLREDEPTARIRVVAWGKLGVEMSENYQVGDRVVLEGRLAMNVIEKDGYKEKRAELVVSHVYPLGQNIGQNSVESQATPATTPATTPANVANLQPLNSAKSEMATSEYVYSNASTVTEDATEEYEEGSLDEIPF